MARTRAPSRPRSHVITRSHTRAARESLSSVEHLDRVCDGFHLRARFLFLSLLGLISYKSGTHLRLPIAVSLQILPIRWENRVLPHLRHHRHRHHHNRIDGITFMVHRHSNIHWLNSHQLSSRDLEALLPAFSLPLPIQFTNISVAIPLNTSMINDTFQHHRCPSNLFTNKFLLLLPFFAFLTTIIPPPSSPLFNQ